MENIILEAIDSRRGELFEAEFITKRDGPGLGVIPVHVLHAKARLGQVHHAVEVVHHIHAGWPLDGDPGNQGNGGGSRGGGGEAGAERGAGEHSGLLS